MVVVMLMVCEVVGVEERIVRAVEERRIYRHRLGT